MKTKLKILLTIVTLAIFTLHTQAQRLHRGSQFPAEIELSDAQKEEIQSINTDFREKMQALKSEEASEATKVAMKQLMDEHKAALDAVLTTAQREKLTAYKAAQRAKADEHRTQMKAMNQELRSYQEENVLPVLKVQRAKLESKISKEDQELIATLRSERTKAGRNGNQMRKSDGMRKPEGRKGRAEGDKRGQGTNPEKHAQVKALVDKYSADMDALYQEIATQEQQWQADRKAIVAKYRAEQPEKKDAVKDFKSNNAGAGRSNEKGDFRKKLSFLLLDPKAEAPVQLNQIKRQVNAFPNPASDLQNLEFEVLKTGKVTVEIIDQQGNIIKTVFSGNLEQGLNKLEIPMEGMKSMLYFYRITDAAGVSTQPFMKK